LLLSIGRKLYLAEGTDTSPSERKLEFVASIRDPLYGLIPITELENEVLATGRLQTLRRIKQLGLVNITYPGANHSRFEHMVGVMHLTSILLDEFQRRHESDLKDRDKQTVRLAGLLHDVGHGPFSHTFEELAKIETAVDHEKMTQIVLQSDTSLGDILGWRVRQIARFLKGGSLGGIPGELVNGDIGTDRMDYLIRDTYYTGLGHRPDISSLVSSVRLVRSKKGGPRIAVAHEDKSCVELLSTARYYHFSMIAHRRECRTSEYLLLQAIATHLRGYKSDWGRSNFLLKAFSRFDDSKLVAELRSRSNKFMQKLDDGKSFAVPYAIDLGHIRYAVAKYCLYRLYYSRQGLGYYSKITRQRLSKHFLRRYCDDLFVDLKLWNHNVSDVISYRESYQTKKDRFSALLSDESFILRDIAGAEALSSTLSVYASLKRESSMSKLSKEIENRREIMLSDRNLVPLTRKLVRKYGLCTSDEVLILLHSLNDFYKELVKEKELAPKDIDAIPYLRGITRLTVIADRCSQKVGRPSIVIKGYWPRDENKPFVYSTELFSILNALHHLGIIELIYWPERSEEAKAFTQTWFLRIKVKVIRQKVFEGMPSYEKLRRDYLNTFRSEALKRIFKKFYADDDKKVIGGPSSRAHSD